MRELLIRAARGRIVGQVHALGDAVVRMRVVMETLGHSQIALTMNLYSHVAPALQREAADRMDDLLGAV